MFITCWRVALPFSDVLLGPRVSYSDLLRFILVMDPKASLAPPEAASENRACSMSSVCVAIRIRIGIGISVRISIRISIRRTHLASLRNIK